MIGKVEEEIGYKFITRKRKIGENKWDYPIVGKYISSDIKINYREGKRYYNLASWGEGRTNKCFCSFCNNVMPKYIRRFDFSFISRSGYNTSSGTHYGAWQGNLRICEKCILGLAKDCSRSRIKKWEMWLLAGRL